MRRLATVFIILALAAIAQGQTQHIEDPVKKLEDAAHANPESAETWYKLGEADRKSFTRSRAKAAFEKAIELRPDYAEAHYGLASWYLAPSGCGNTIIPSAYYEKAIDLYREAILLKPDYSEAHYGLGRAFERLQRYEEAASAYEEATRLNPELKDAYFDLAETYERLDRLEAALYVYRQVIEQNSAYKSDGKDGRWSFPGSDYFYSAHHSIASIYRKMGRYQDALEVYRKILELKIDTSTTHYGLGLTYVDLGDGQSALAEYQILTTLQREENLDVMQGIIKKEADKLFQRIERLK